MSWIRPALWRLALVVVCALLGSSPASADEYDPARTKCRLVYNASGWSFVYKTMDGTGRITCDNGQQLDVTIKVRAGGATAGRSEIIGGRGTFTSVRDIGELPGSYVELGAHAGMTGSAAASVVTNGLISLALSGTGNGVDLGVSVGSFRIEKAP